RSIDTKGAGFHWLGEPLGGAELEQVLATISRPTEHRLVDVQQVLRAGVSLERVYELTRIDPWFLDQIVLVNEVAAEVAAADELTADVLRHAKRHGLSDAQVAQARGLALPAGEAEVRAARLAAGVRPACTAVAH